ncbi:hypothetical protein PTSG_02496 [Salpingoeca rosetta]|uniref:Aminotransferase class I/classII large domain-containing protein n=1 Tax=Salpingoeca rosetta (strain ATCC 50818 / BSB-021) TaxID=946362 RepID=F2U2D1_SALR5|nr:uncharacterized protein PTSG_02496 [Salpingoeca rosetta]EGD81783.1 hypothetical protein PTSG_02496 [Salpingoeca rosetta]|eukprot:XP_004996987.1 hypothetical protein PTSG_02496 [Salpingoeca rosetta]
MVLRAARPLLSRAQTWTADALNPQLLKAQYAVRGAIPLRAGQIAEDLRKGVGSYPFDKVVFANIGNPQSLRQEPITFFRQVLSVLELSSNAGNHEHRKQIENLFPKDVVERADAYLQSGGLIGAYSDSNGIRQSREEVARYISDRDGYPASPDDIFLTAGASEGIANVLEALIANDNVGVMIPIPQYPLYSATITLCNGRAVHYYLDEENAWDMSLDELKRSIAAARNEGTDVRALAVINPGNPTGQCLSREAIENVIRFCNDEGLVLLADEVYQTNTYDATRPFFSFKSVLRSIPECSESVPLFSFHSLSKGMLGECGRRGGYMEMTNIDQSVRENLLKRASINLCASVAGQAMVGMMCQPPKPGDESYPLYNEQFTATFESLKRRAQKLSDAFNSMPGVSCIPPTGAMYLFPRIELSSTAQDAAAKKGLAPDAWSCSSRRDWCCVVPGSGFGQREGTFHFRCTFLPPEEDIDGLVDSIRAFQEKWVATYGL